MAHSQNEIKILSHLQHGDIASARALLSAWQSADDREQLRHRYCQGKIALYEGSYLKALEAFQAYHHLHPHELDVLCDMALCLYQLGLQAELNLILKKCHDLFKLNTSGNFTQKDIDHAILIAKLYEEKAEHLLAQEILQEIPETDISPLQAHSLKVQLLRIEVELQDLSRVRELYAKVISGLSLNLNFEIEREHALLLADASLFGFQQAKERFEYALTHKLSAADLNFLKSEMAELAILNKNYEFLNELSLQTESESTYEREQAKLVNSYLRNEAPPSLSIVRLEKQLSPMSLLRLLRQAIVLFADSQSSSTWIERYKFHCFNLPSRETQKIYLSVLNNTGSEPTVLFVNSQRKVIIQNGKEHTVKSNLFWNLLKAFSKNQTEISIDEAIAAAYEEVPNEQHFDRLRIGLYRLNSNLQKDYSLVPLFQITKSKITITMPTKEHNP